MTVVVIVQSVYAQAFELERGVCQLVRLKVEGFVDVCVCGGASGSKKRSDVSGFACKVG